MLIMPLLSLMLLSVIITNIRYPGQPTHWPRSPPPHPHLLRFHTWLIREWNLGLYPKPRYKRNRNTEMHGNCNLTTDTVTTEDTYPDINQELLIPSPDLFDQVRTRESNIQLQALLYTMSMPAQDRTMHFGSDSECICINTGASACISTRREKFVKLQAMENIKINGIGTSLPVEGVGTLKWPIRDDNNNELDAYVHNALYVPSTPMGLLCPQKIAMQTQHPGDGFNTLGHAGILTMAGYTRTIPYNSRSRLPILHSIDGAQCYLSSTNNTEKETTLSDNLTGKQQSLL
jgi:hypothetical protein